MDEQCLACPRMSLESEIIECGDMLYDRSYPVHKCKHVDFCESVLRSRKDK